MASPSNGSLALYSGSNCSDFNPIYVSGSADGICTQITNSFWSFKIHTLDTPCTVTVYANDNSYCGDGRKYEIFQGQCVRNDTTISQFSVDCPSRAVSSSGSSTASQPDTNLGLILGLAIGIPLSIIIAIVPTWLWLRRRRAMRKKKKGLQTGPPSCIEAECNEKATHTEVPGEMVRERSELAERSGGNVHELSGDDKAQMQRLEGSTECASDDNATERR